MTLLEWRDEKYQLGIKEMDDTHKEFADLVNRLAALKGDEKAFQALFEQLGAHTRAHFAHEERLMKESGFPALQEHCAEHAKILGQFAQINRIVQKGRIGFGHAFVEDVPHWFELHAATMDSALAAHLKHHMKSASIA